MKYTKKQIKEAYIKWISEDRLNPSEFMKDEEVNEMDVVDCAKLYAKTLVDYIND